MTVKWTGKAASDLIRLHEHLASIVPGAALRAVQRLAHAPDRLQEFPRIGEKLDAYAPREVRALHQQRG